MHLFHSQNRSHIFTPAHHTTHPLTDSSSQRVNQNKTINTPRKRTDQPAAINISNKRVEGEPQKPVPVCVACEAAARQQGSERAAKKGSACGGKGAVRSTKDRRKRCACGGYATPRKRHAQQTSVVCLPCYRPSLKQNNLFGAVHGFVLLISCLQSDCIGSIS